MERRLPHTSDYLGPASSGRLSGTGGTRALPLVSWGLHKEKTLAQAWGFPGLSGQTEPQFHKLWTPHADVPGAFWRNHGDEKRRGRGTLFHMPRSARWLFQVSHRKKCEPEDCIGREDEGKAPSADPITAQAAREVTSGDHRIILIIY